MNSFELVIAGGGLAAARAIKSYREAGGGGRVAMLAAERHLPYHRPALSKRYLRGETGPPFAEDEAFYRDHDVEVLLGTPARSVEPWARLVTSAQGSLRYDRLLVATGATPRRLAVAGAQLEGVHSLRTLDDSDRIREAARRATRAVVVGGGFIGMEAAASLRRLGVEQVTLIHVGTGLFDQLRTPSLSEQLLSLYRDNSVDVLLEHEVARFGGDDRLEWVECTNGHCVAADIAVVGVGVVPNVDFLARSGIAVDNGIIVNERFEATAPGVFAAGDVANFYDPLFGRHRRIEHWSNANYQGGEVGKILAGQGGGYDAVSSFFSEVFGTTIKVYGDTSRFDDLHEEGSIDDRFLAGYGDGGRLVGAITVGHSEEFEASVRNLIAMRAPTDALESEFVGRSL
jgi:3-phenylpropionate/trans-cinnamate dioxygenase ferredoxin reductase component